MMRTSRPLYDELPLNDDGIRTAWAVFPDPEILGLVGQVGAGHVRHAASLVRSGQVFALNAPLDHFDPPLFGRPQLRQDVQPVRVNWGLNEVLHDLNPQSSSQWDALSHVAYRPGQFYAGSTFDDIVQGGRNTVAAWAARGMAGRGVLLDLARSAESSGAPYDPGSSHSFSVADLERARRDAGVELTEGDFLLLRTGFTQWYEAAGADTRKRASQREAMTACGIEHTEDMARYLWDAGVVAVASDCPAVEVWPMDHSAEAFPWGCLHQVLIGQFGMALGELWWLEDLAEACAADGVHEFLLTSAPLNYRSFGSPSNALAIR